MQLTFDLQPPSFIAFVAPHSFLFGLAPKRREIVFAWDDSMSPITFRRVLRPMGNGFVQGDLHEDDRNRFEVKNRLLTLRVPLLRPSDVLKYILQSLHDLSDVPCLRLDFPFYLSSYFLETSKPTFLPSPPSSNIPPSRLDETPSSENDDSSKRSSSELSSSLAPTRFEGRSRSWESWRSSSRLLFWSSFELGWRKWRWGALCV